MQTGRLEGLTKEELMYAVNRCLSRWLEAQAYRLSKVEKLERGWKSLKPTIQAKKVLYKSLMTEEMRIFEEKVVLSAQFRTVRLSDVYFGELILPDETILTKVFTDCKSRRIRELQALACKIRKIIKSWLIFDTRDDFVIKMFGHVFVNGFENPIERVQRFEEELAEQMDFRMELLDIELDKKNSRWDDKRDVRTLVFCSHEFFRRPYNKDLEKKISAKAGGIFSQFLEAMRQQTEYRRRGLDFYYGKSPLIRLRPPTNKIEQFAEDEFVERRFEQPEPTEVVEIEDADEIELSVMDETMAFARGLPEQNQNLLIPDAKKMKHLMEERLEKMMLALELKARKEAREQEEARTKRACLLDMTYKEFCLTLPDRSYIDLDAKRFLTERVEICNDNSHVLNGHDFFLTSPEYLYKNMLNTWVQVLPILVRNQLCMLHKKFHDMDEDFDDLELAFLETREFKKFSATNYLEEELDPETLEEYKKLFNVRLKLCEKDDRPIITSPEMAYAVRKYVKVFLKKRLAELELEDERGEYVGDKKLRYKILEDAKFETHPVRTILGILCISRWHGDPDFFKLEAGFMEDLDAVLMDYW